MGPLGENGNTLCLVTCFTSKTNVTLLVRTYAEVQNFLGIIFIFDEVQLTPQKPADLPLKQKKTKTITFSFFPWKLIYHKLKRSTVVQEQSRLLRPDFTTHIAPSMKTKDNPEVTTALQHRTALLAMKNDNPLSAQKHLTRQQHIDCGYHRDISTTTQRKEAPTKIPANESPTSAR